MSEYRRIISIKKNVTIGDLENRTGFYVADDCPGISEEKREEVFKPTHTTTEDGTGFGLAIVREIVEAHEWTIKLTKSDTGGARFEITDLDVP